jgi:hypothetical protein
VGTSGGRRLAVARKGIEKCLKLKRRKLKSAGARRIGLHGTIGAEADGQATGDQGNEEASAAETGAAIAGVNSVSAVVRAALATDVVKGRPKSISTN